MTRTCCVCMESIAAYDLSTLVGDSYAHDHCAEDPLHTRRCAYCYELVLVGESARWVKSDDGWLCPECHARSVAEHASEDAVPSPLAGAVRSLDGLIDEMRRSAS